LHSACGGAGSRSVSGLGVVAAVRLGAAVSPRRANRCSPRRRGVFAAGARGDEPLGLARHPSPHGGCPPLGGVVPGGLRKRGRRHAVHPNLNSHPSPTGASSTVGAVPGGLRKRDRRHAMHPNLNSHPSPTGASSTAGVLHGLHGGCPPRPPRRESPTGVSSQVGCANATGDTLCTPT
jgi:hypothetical protein